MKRVQALQSTPGQQVSNLRIAPLVDRIAALGQELTQIRRANKDLTEEATRLGTISTAPAAHPAR